MANILDYVRWRGDLPIRQVPLCEIDALIMSYLAYMRLDGLVKGKFDSKGVLFSDVARKLLEKPEKERSSMNYDTKSDAQLLEKIADSERFGTMRLTCYVNRVDEEKEKQFSAVTYLLEDDTMFLAYRGTDSTVVGWKEDFNMSFAGQVPAQRDAVEYAERAASRLGRPMVLGGHSKGGNLAAYAGVFMKPEAKKKVLRVYNFDGPGFNEETMAAPEFSCEKLDVCTFVPQSSMVGILLWHREPFTIVKSDSVSVFQHNVYSWQLMAGKLITLTERTSNSHFADETIKRWLEDLQPAHRRQVIDGIYAVLSASDGNELTDLFEVRNIMAIIRAAGAMDDETRSAVAEAFKLLGASLMEGVPSWLDRTANNIFQKVSNERKEAEEDSK